MKIIKTAKFKEAQESEQVNPDMSRAERLGRLQGGINYTITSMEYPIQRLERLGEEIQNDLAELGQGSDIAQYGPYYKNQIDTLVRNFNEALERLKGLSNERV